jgi:lipopolysaccharide transport system ATP-binding protein
MNNIAVKFENISKQYRLGVIGTGTISHDLNRWWAKIKGKEDPYLKIGSVNDRTIKADDDYVWALHKINLNVKRGEVIGIIGKNGAGKSTLLKILSRVTTPTEGLIKARGRIASLLEVGTGFHPEMTGKENIFMNGSIMGMTKTEIKSKFDEIVDFAGIEKYINTPVKRFSSGMTVRLGFAIAAHLEPEILVVDEVLAVGDAEFQKKALGKMQRVGHEGNRTILFVSHNMIAIKNLCNRTVILENGNLIFDGDTDKGIDLYLKSANNYSDVELINVIESLPYDEHFKLLNLFITQKGILISDYVYSDLPINVTISYHIRSSISGFRLFIDIYDKFDTLILRSFFDENGIAPSSISGGDYLSHVEIPANLLGPTFYEIRIQAGIYNQRMCLPTDAIKIGFKVENHIYNRAYPGDTFRQKIAPILKWETKKIESCT